MAKQVVVLVVDDLDQEPIDGGGEHIEFTINGVEYSIDLRDSNAKDFRDTFGYYIGFATKLSPSRTRTAPSPSANTSVIRAWARQNGFDVSGRGRISAEVRAAYAAATA